jgi:SAM-dependent methyltransferase
MFNALKKYYFKQQYQPGVLGLFVNPFYFARKGLYQNISDLGAKITGKTLDVGCGQKPYERLFGSVHYVGLEIDSPDNRKQKKADYFYDGTAFPFQQEEFDSVVANEVFEHVFNPVSFLGEIRRVLKKDGFLLLTVPFVWDEHEQPYDYARYSSFGLSSLLKNNGFVIIEQRKSVNDIRVVFQLLNEYIYKKTVTGNTYLNLLITLVCMAPFNVLGEILSGILPDNDDLYLDNVILAKKVANA